MRKLITVCLVIAVLALFSGNAQASGWFNWSQRDSHRLQSHVQPHLHWHDTSHFDYHGPQVMPHRNHFHVTPGHYHLHQTGHYDLHW